MAASFFFYDLETSGFDPKRARIMQFAGQRTDGELRLIDEPVNILIKLTPDILPDPDAVLVTGITPQATMADGITEAAFLQFFNEHVATPQTTFLGYNSVRFDDEFMRHTFYRNFCDAYEWQWCDDCSRWDLLDVVRMTRALRPDGITWPFAPDGSATNRLEFLTSVNGLDHESAHDALSDVRATIAMARLIKDKQPKLFHYLFNMRQKRSVAELVRAAQPFLYTSGSYPGETHKTTAAVMLVEDTKQQAALVYDLRYNPTPLLGLSAPEIAQKMAWRPRGVQRETFPVKSLRFNRCPAVAPLNVLDAASQTRLQLDQATINTHYKVLAENPAFAEHVYEAVKLSDKGFPQSSLVGDDHAVDGQLYDGFLPDNDKKLLPAIRTAAPETLPGGYAEKLQDVRLQSLLKLYKARNYPHTLTSDERAVWDTYCSTRLTDGGPKSRLVQYFTRLETLAAQPQTTDKQRYLLEELRLYGESLLPGN